MKPVQPKRKSLDVAMMTSNASMFQMNIVSPTVIVVAAGRLDAAVGAAAEVKVEVSQLPVEGRLTPDLSDGAYGSIRTVTPSTLNVFVPHTGSVTSIRWNGWMRSLQNA